MQAAMVLVGGPISNNNFSHVSDGRSFSIRSSNQCIGCFNPVPLVDQMHLYGLQAIPLVVGLLLVLVATLRSFPGLGWLSSSNSEFILRP